jgi:hypothetical protein
VYIKDKIVIINISKKFFLGYLQNIIAKFKYKDMIAEITIDSDEPLTEDEIKDRIIAMIKEE